MSTMYGILSAAGWAWAIVFFAVLGVAATVRRVRRRRTARQRGFEVMTEHEKPL